jgi:hypothetical protein
LILEWPAVDLLDTALRLFDHCALDESDWLQDGYSASHFDIALERPFFATVQLGEGVLEFNDEVVCKGETLIGYAYLSDDETRTDEEGLHCLSALVGLRLHELWLLCHVDYTQVV